MSNVKERQDINESDIKCEGGVKKNWEANGKLNVNVWERVRNRERREERRRWSKRLMWTETSFRHTALMRWDTGDLNRNYGKGCKGVGMETPCYHGNETVFRSRWLTELLSVVNFTSCWLYSCSLRETNCSSPLCYKKYIAHCSN